MGMLLVLLIRLTVPLTILRWPFWGTIAALLADGIDIIIFQMKAYPGDEYQRLDKLLDGYYLLLQLVVVQRWPSPERWVLNALFAYRMVGFIWYELTDRRELLLYFPNLFTFYFALVAGIREFRPAYTLTSRRAVALLAAILTPVLLLEYALHSARWFDRWRAVDIIEGMTDAIARALPT